MKNTKKTSLRAFVSVSIFVLVIILFITDVLMEVFEEIIDPEVYASLILNPELRDTHHLARINSIANHFHVICGFLFIILSVIHIVKNWKALKSYLTRR